MFFGIFLAPIVIIIVFNIIMFMIGMRALIKSTREKTMRGGRRYTRPIVELIVGVCLLMVLFGVGWLFCVLTIDKVSKVFEYVFVFLNVFQGFFIFVFICLLGKDGRNFWMGLIRNTIKSKSSITKTVYHIHASKVIRSGSSVNSRKDSNRSSKDSTAGLVFQNSYQLKYLTRSLTDTTLWSLDDKADEQETLEDTPTNGLPLIIEEESSVNNLKEDDAVIQITLINETLDTVDQI